MRDALRVMRERGLAVLAVGAVFALVAAMYDSQTEKFYGSYAEVEIRTLTPFTPFLGISPLVPELRPEHTPARVAGLLSRGEITRDAARRLGKKAPPYDIAARTGAVSAPSPGRVIVAVSDIDRERGRRVALAVAGSVVAHINRVEIARLGRATAALRRERRTIRGGRGAEFTSQFRRAELDRQLLRMGIVRRVARPATVIGEAESSDEPIFKPYERVLPALLFGLSLGLVGAFLLDAVAVRPRDPRRLAEAAGMPLVGQAPRRTSRDTVGLHLSYERLRLALPRGGGHAPRTVMVTSAREGEGKSTVAAELARAEAVVGGRACLVDCDLTHPVVGERLGVDGPGLADLAAGSATDAEITHRVGGEAAFDVVPARAVAGGAPDVLSAPVVEDLIRGLAQDHDLVVLDAPELLGSSEAARLVDLADAVLVCAWAGRTTLPDLELVRDALAGRPDLGQGLVVTGGPVRAQPGGQAAARYVAAGGGS